MKTETDRIKNAHRIGGPEHTAPCPFPVKARDGRFIVDERCRCGAKRSEHDDTVAWGHGPCEGFTCSKYTFVKFIFASDLQQAKLAREAKGTSR